MNKKLIDAAVEMLDAESTLILNAIDQMDAFFNAAKAKDEYIQALLNEVSRLSGEESVPTVPGNSQEALRMQVRILQEVCSGITEAIGVLRVVSDNLSGEHHG